MLVDLGVNPLPVKGFRSQWIYTQFDRALITGHIGWKFIEITLYPCLVELGISVNSTGFRSQSIYTQFDQSNSTGQIGCKSIEIDAGNSLRLHCVPAWSNWVSSQ